MLNIDLAARIKISFGSLKVIIGSPLFWVGVIVILLFFLRRWGLKKFISFSIVISVLLFLMFRLDSFIVNLLGKEEGIPFSFLTKPFFLAAIAFVFLYYNFMRKE
ncbi:hypothetical protein HQ550_02900 [bacterium]|nr:hypothetical protein [bacterium]